jgi:hypothetical protein
MTHVSHVPGPRKRITFSPPTLTAGTGRWSRPAMEAKTGERCTKSEPAGAIDFRRSVDLQVLEKAGNIP